MEFEEKKEEVMSSVKVNLRSSGASLMSVALTEEDESSSDTSSDNAEVTSTVEALLKGARRKSQSDQRFWPSRKHHKLSRRFMMPPRNSFRQDSL